MQTYIIIFLGVTVAALAIVLTVITTRYINLCRECESDDTNARISQLVSEKKALVLDKFRLEAQNDELYSDNVKLTEAVKELRKINQELMNTAPTVTEPKEETTKLLPEGHTNTYRCEDFHLFHPKSSQYSLQEACITDVSTGIRMLCTFTGSNLYGQYYCAALGGAYGTDIGHAYRVKLKCGTEFNIVLADFKHPIDNVRADDYGDADTNYDGQPCTCVIEFVVDMASVPDKVKKAGTMSALDRFGGLYGDGGDIEAIEDLGRKWSP